MVPGFYSVKDVSRLADVNRMVGMADASPAQTVGDDQQLRLIIEAKIVGSRHPGFAIREAVGQLMEYRHFLGRWMPNCASC
jgi:hypothetical protein